MSEAPAPYQKGEAQTYRSRFGRRGRTMTLRGSIGDGSVRAAEPAWQNCPPAVLRQSSSDLAPRGTSFARLRDKVTCFETLTILESAEQAALTRVLSGCNFAEENAQDEKLPGCCGTVLACRQRRTHRTVPDNAGASPAIGLALQQPGAQRFPKE